jgi:predicted acetyltransferase
MVGRLELALPAARYETSFLVAERESGREPEPFAEMLVASENRRAGIDLPEGWVAATMFWLVEGDEYLGRVTIRHSLTDALRAVGGHIGYEVRPSRRRQGLGTMMLALALPRAAELGIDPALITCDVINVASRRMIQRAGGQLESASDGKLRFWVPTAR